MLNLSAEKFWDISFTQSTDSPLPVDDVTFSTADHKKATSEHIGLSNVNTVYSVGHKNTITESSTEKETSTGPG